MGLESIGQNPLKQLSEAADQADGSVVGWLVGVFIGFRDHGHYGGFPRFRKIAYLNAAGAQL